MTEGDAVRVCVRVRPLIQREQGDQVNLLWKTEKSTISQVDGTKSFNFDRVFHSNETSDQVYQEMAIPIIQSVLHGYHGTIFAYGQTSSGKTYTMMGTANSIGIIPQAVQDTFKIIQEIPNREFLLRVSYMEIYNETVTDLLCDDRKKKPLEVREDLDRNVYVADLTEEIVMVPDQVMKWIKKGEKNRHYGETKMNEHSSRSHTIFRMIIESRERSDPGNSENCDGAVMVSHLNLVDLAGSERASQTGAEGVRLKEGCNINRSLFILGQVIKKLSDGQAGGFINYRDSKLTRILQNSLGGNTKTLIICTVTPVSFDETLSTLQFASTAKHVRNTPHVNEVLDDQALLKRYRKEILDLKKQLEQLEASSGVRTHAMAKEEHAQLLAEIQQLQKERENRIWNLTSIIIAPSQEFDKDQKAKRKRRVTWAPGKLKNSLGSSCFSDFDVPSTSNFIKKRKFSDLPLLTQVDESICTEVSDFDETVPELDLNPMGKVAIRDKKTAAFCQSMIEFDSEDPFLGSNQFNDFSQQKSKEMEKKITDLESQLKKMTQEYESDAKEKESFANEIVNLKEKLQLKEEETKNIVNALELEITNLEGQLHTVGTREPIKKCSVDIKELHSEKDKIQGGKMAALEELQTTLSNHVVEEEIIAEKFSSDHHHLREEHILMLEQKVLDLEQTIETLGMQLQQDENAKYHTGFIESIQLCEALMTEKGTALKEMNTMRNNYDGVILENESLKREIKELEQQLNEKNDTKEFEGLEKEMQKEHEAQLMHEIVSLKKVVENAEVYNQDLEADLEIKSNLLKDQNKQIHELKKTVDVLQKKVRNLDLSSSMGDSDKLCEEVFQLKQSLADAEAVTRDAQKESAFLKSENRELKEKMDHLSRHSQQREKDASTYEKQLEAEKAKFKKMQADLQKELQYSFNEINHLNGLMAGKVPKDLLARVELEKEIQNYSKQLAEITEEKRVLETEVSSLSEYKSLPDEIEHLKTQLSQATEELSLLKEQQSLVCKKDNTIQEQSNQINRLTEEVAEVQAKFHETEEQFAELKKAHKELEEQYLSSSEMLILKQNESECLAKEREELQCAINCMEIQLSTTLKELDQAVKDKEGLLHEQDIFVKNQQVAHTVMEEKSSQFTIPLHNLDEVKSLVTEKDAVLKSVEKERDHLQEQVNNLCSQVELLQEQTNELHKGEEMYKQQQSRMKLEVEQLQICLKEAQVSLDVTQEEKLEVFHKLECIERDLVLVDQQRRELLSSLENIKAERDDLRRDLNENIELSIETQDELRSSLKELKEHKMLVGELRAQLQDASTSIPFNLKGQQASVAEGKLYDDKLALETAHYNLTREADLLREQIKVLEQAREEAENKLPSLEEQLCFATNERDDARNMQESLEKEMDVIKAELESKIKEIQRLTGELNVLSECNQLSNGEVNLQKLQEKLLAVDQEKSELYEILENVRVEKDQLKIELQENTETSVVTQEELSSALEELKTKDKLLDDMKSQLCIQETLTENLEKDLKHEVFQLEENLNVLTNDRDKLAAELVAALDEKLKLDGLVSALTEEIHALQEKSFDSSKMSALAEKLQDNEAKYQELSSKKDALEAAHQSLICELERVKAAEVALEIADQENAKDLRKPCTLAEQQTMTCQVDEVKSMDESLEGEINIVEKNEVMSLKEELEQTRAENTLDELQDQPRLRSEVENLLLKLDETQSTIEYLQREKNETEQALGDLQSQMEAITLERDELKVTETSLISERDKLNRSVEESNKMIAHLKNELQKKAMDDQQMVQEKHVEAQERLTDEVEELRKNMNDTEATLQILQLDKAEMELKLLTVQQLMETLVKERDGLKIIQENLISEKDQLLGNLKEYMDKVDHIQTNVTQASANEQETVLKSKLELSREGSTDGLERPVRTINNETTLLNVAKDQLETQKNLLDLQQQIDLLNQERDELKLKQVCLKSEKDQLKADLEEQMDMLLQKESESQQMAHEKQELELAHQSLKDELEQVMRNMAEANANLQTLQQDRLDMEQRLLSLHEQMEIQAQERDELKLKQDSLQKDAEKNAYLGKECQEKSIEDQRMIQERTMEPYQPSCSDEVEQIMKNMKDLETLHKGESKTEQELLNLQQQLETLTRDRDGLRISHEHLTSERDQMKQNLKETMDMVVNIKNELLQKAAEGQQMEQEKQELELAHQRLKDELEQLMKNMTDTEEKLQALQKNKCVSDQQLHSLQQQMEILVQERDDLKSAQDCMISERNQLKEDLENQTQLLLNSKNEQKVAEDQMTANGKLIDEVQQRCKDEVEQITGRLKETEAKVNALEEELERKQTVCNLKQQIENLTQEREELMVAQGNLISERDQLKEELKENVEMTIVTQDDLRKAQDEVQHHKHKMHQMTSQISLLEEKLAVVEKQVAEKETLLSETLGTKDLLKHSKQEQDLKVEQLNQALENSECALQQVLQEKNEALLSKQSLAEKIESMSEERGQLQQVKETLQEEVKKLNEELELLKRQHDLLKTLHSDGGKQLKEKFCQVEQLKGTLQQNDCRALQLEDEKDSLQNQIREQDVKISSLNLEQVQFQQLLQRLRSEKESIYSELQTQEKLSSQLREELNKCHADLQATRNQKEEETGQTNANVKLDELSQQIKSLQQKIEQLQQTINEERNQNLELRDEIERKDKDILLLNLKLSLPPEEEEDELEERIDSFKNKTQEMMDLLVKISGIYSDQYNLIGDLSREMQNEAETSKTAMSRMKDFLSHTQSRSFRTLQTEHTKIHSQLKAVIYKFKVVCMNATVKEEQYSLIKDCEEELIAEQKKHDEIELQIQCLEQHGTKWTDSAAEDLKFYELEFLSKMICKKCDFIKHVEEDFSEIQEVLSSTENALQDEVKRERSFYMWLNEFSSPNFDVTELNEGFQQENRRIIGMIQLMTNKLKAIIPSKTQRAVSEYLKQMQTELESTKEKYNRLSKKIQHVAPSGNTSALEEENVRLRENIRGLQAELKKMQSRIKILEDQLNASRAEAKQKEEKVASLQSNLLSNTAETELVKIRAQLTEKESTLRSLQTEMESLQRTIAKGAKPYREEIDNLKTQVVKREMEKMKMSKTMDQEIASLKSCIEDKEECLRKLKEQLRRTQKDCDTSVCSDKKHPVSSNFPLTCGGGSGIVQSTAMLVLQSEKAKLEKQLSFYKRRYSQHSKTTTFREDKKTTVSETPASPITSHPSCTTESLSKSEPETVDQISPTKSDFPNLYLASPGKTGRQWKRPPPTYMAQTNKRAPLSPSKSARHSMATASPSKMGMHPKSVMSPDRASIPVPNALTASPCKNQNLLKTLESPKSRFFDVRSKSLPYCQTQFFDNSMLGTLPDVKNLESAAEKDTAAWWYEKKETANECKTS